LRTQLPLADNGKARIRVVLSKQGNSIDREGFQSGFGEVLAQHRHELLHCVDGNEAADLIDHLLNARCALSAKDWQG
jgi:hypothetical protein